MKVEQGLAIWVTPDPAGRYIGPPVRPRTRRNRESMAAHIRVAVGSADLEHFGRSEVWILQQHCLAAGLSHQSTNHVTHNILRALFRDLESVGLVDESIFLRIRKAKKLRRVRNPKCRCYDAAERDRALDALRGTWGYGIALCLFTTGMRVGEAAGLQWRDVSADCAQITIERCRDGDELSDGKTESSQRVILATAEFRTCLLSLPRGAPEDYVLRGAHGRPFDIHTFRSCWRRVLAAAGLPFLNPHGARHTWATIALTCGIPIAQVAAHLGDTEKIVASTYAHVLPKFDPNVAVGRPASLPPVTHIVAERARGHLRLVR